MDAVVEELLSENYDLTEETFSLGQGDLGGIENETLDFSQLEKYIIDGNEMSTNMYFSEELVNDDIHPETEDEQTFAKTTGRTKLESTTNHRTHVDNVLVHGTTATQLLGHPGTFRNLPDSPPDSGSEPPFSPPNEDGKTQLSTISGSLEALQHNHRLHLHHDHLVDSPDNKRFAHQSMAVHLQASPHHNYHHHHHLSHHHSAIHHHHLRDQPQPIALQSSQSASLPLLSVGTLTQVPLLSHLSQNTLSPNLSLAMQHQTQPMMTPPGGHMEHLYSGDEKSSLYNSDPNNSTPTFKKRKISNSPKTTRNCPAEMHIKTEPALSSSPEHQHLAPSSDDDYNTMDVRCTEGGSPVGEANFQCIRFQPFHHVPWVTLLDDDMNDIGRPHFQVDADKGFNFSNADESFVCQKKNHFQVTVHVQMSTEKRPTYIRTSDGIRAVEKFSIQFHGVKMESPSQTIKVEQSQSDRSKKPFKPVSLEMLFDQVSKTTVGRLHFSETTTNNMRKKGKPNPDQRFFFLVISLCAHPVGDSDSYQPVIAFSSEKIIVRASNPGQFENDMELSWQKGSTPDSIFHAGRVGINTDRPEESLVVHGNIKVAGHIVQPSDMRAKVDVHELDSSVQLKNVSNLRIVRYRYLPEFAAHVGVSELDTDTGVIAQEVMTIIPEAVMESDDVILSDGQLVDRLLVVNKERIFMENVGAVKELCKVTDNLEIRIDELERFSKKMSTTQRKDSLKSNFTDSSLRRSRTTRGKCRKYEFRTFKSAKSCSSRFLQSTIVTLVLIMALCLVALATLYILEYQNRHWLASYIPEAVTLKSSTSKNNTMFSTVPTVTSLESNRHSASVSTTIYAGTTPNERILRSTAESPLTVPRIFGQCPHRSCPAYCCEDNREVPLYSMQDEDVHEEKRNGYREKEDPEFLATRTKNKDVPTTWERWTTDDKDEVEEKTLMKRSIDNDVPKNDQDDPDEAIASLELHLLELNISLSNELCKNRDDSQESRICHVFLSKHYPMTNITLVVNSDMTSEFCDMNHVLACPSGSESTDKANFPSEPEHHFWKLPAGLYLESSYRFRFASGSENTKLCDMRNTTMPITEYIITFERRCDV